MKVNVIWGCPASGKSTYVSEHRGNNDISYDFDLIMGALSGLEPHYRNNNLIPYVLGIREYIINALKTEKDLDSAWIIATWVDDAFKEKLKDFKDITYILMNTTEAECIKRVNKDKGRIANNEGQLVKDWFIKYNNLKQRNKLRLLLDLM